MNIPPNLTAHMNQPGGGMPPGMGAPASAPMSTPQPNAGEKQAAMAQVQMAMDVLERALPGLGSETEEGQAIINVLGSLSKSFGGAQRAKSKELVPAEIQNMLAALPKGAGGAPGGMPGGAPMPGGGMPHPPMPPMGGRPM